MPGLPESFTPSTVDWTVIVEPLITICGALIAAGPAPGAAASEVWVEPLVTTNEIDGAKFMILPSIVNTLSILEVVVQPAEE